MFQPIQKLTPISTDISLASYGDDTGLFVEFLWHPVKNEKKSLELGRDFFENREYIRITAPGDRTKAWFRPVRKVSNGIEPPDTVRWPRQWGAFQNQQKQVPDGLPLEECSFLSPSDVKNLKGHDIHTAEQLAALSDNNLGVLLGARTLREKAKLIIDKAKDGAFALQMQKQNEDLQTQITALQNQLQGFTNSGIVVPEKVDTSPRKPGRPKVKDVKNVPPTDASSR